MRVHSLDKIFCFTPVFNLVCFRELKYCCKLKEVMWLHLLCICCHKFIKAGLDEAIDEELHVGRHLRMLRLQRDVKGMDFVEPGQLRPDFCKRVIHQVLSAFEISSRDCKLKVCEVRRCGKFLKLSSCFECLLDFIHVFNLCLGVHSDHLHHCDLGQDQVEFVQVFLRT